MATYTGAVKSFALQAGTPGIARRQTSLQRTPSGIMRRSFTLERGLQLYTTGGNGRVRGNILTTPSNPVARVVYLYTENDHLLYRSQMSDPVTGAFDFQRLPMGLTYIAVAVDHTGQYRAETHDRLVPEPMP